ncbi:hypothetical protein ISE1_0669 [plant metagenome]|uniref:Uncharacterized protein n=1 Tax=plant metagenome TaxID=1297885 RepID=A0A484UAH3_9ZZZZ
MESGKENKAGRGRGRAVERDDPDGSRRVEFYKNDNHFYLE